MVYLIKYYYTGFWASFLPKFYPDGIKFVSASNSDEALEKFRKLYKDREPYSIKYIK